MLPLTLLAAILWTALGWPLARRLLPVEVPALCVAPALGWCVQTALSLTVLPLMAFDRWHILLVTWLVACPVLGLAVLGLAVLGGRRGARMPAWLPVAAGLVAVVPMLGVLPHGSGAALSLSMPIFDHSKIAIIDAVARGGLPPGDAFYGGDEAGAHLTYYWWWHASAAELARVAGVSGWTADAALTWFTAWASLMLMGGIALALQGGGAAWMVLAISLAGSLHPLLGVVERWGWLRGGSGLGGWLNQASWAPQHMAAGSALVLACLLLAGLAEHGVLAAAVLGCVVAAGFGSSTWVGGVACAVALPLATGALLPRLSSRERLRLLLLAGAGALVALALVAPLLRDEWAGARLRGVGTPLMLAPYQVFGDAVPAGIRPVADALGFPLLLLVEFPAVAVFGALGIWGVLRSPGPAWRGALAGLGGGALLVCGWLRSTIDNNDLGWRAAVPALLAFTPFAAAWTWRWLRAGGARAALAALPTLLGGFGSAGLLRDNALGDPHRADPAFAGSASAWAAVRAVTGPFVRVANDPALASGMTLWRANIDWALLADRPSCYSGWATAHALVPLPADALYRTELELGRVFAGHPLPGDVRDMAVRLHCGAVLLLPGEAAWGRDPFAGSAAYRLAVATAAYRIYLAR